MFKVKVLKPTYTIALLSALAFLLVATMPLISHLGKPMRFFEIMITPHFTSAMAIFGFVYLWYLMVVLLLEIWFDYRRDLVLWSQEKKGIMKHVYKILTLGVTDISPNALKWDDKLGYALTVIGIPSAFLLHGYVGFIFGSVKANPWWSTVLMPVIFIFSAMVSGIALVMIIFMLVNYVRKQIIDMKCLDMIARFLLVALILDFALEGLDQVHRIYEAEESFQILDLLVKGKLTYTLFLFQWGLGMLVPIVVLAYLQIFRSNLRVRKILYFISAFMVLIGIFFMRWNVVIGGQLFSKSFLGFTAFKLKLVGTEGVGMAAVWIVLPCLILLFLFWLLPPWKRHPEEVAGETEP